MEPHPDPLVPPDQSGDHLGDQPPAWEHDPRVREALAMALAMALSDAQQTSSQTDTIDTTVAFERLLAARAAFDAHPIARRPRADGLTEPSRSSDGRATPLSGLTPRPPMLARPPRPWLMAAYGIAAATIALALVPVVRTVRHRSTTAHTYTADRAQRVAMTLPDGSSVILAPETQLRFVIDEQNTRIVELVGEAFFTVAPRPDQPFLVRTGTVTTRVLGTAFDVRRYADDRETRIAVVSGRVATGGTVAPVVLPAGAVAHATDSTVTVSAGEPTQVAAWTQGRLIFHNTPAAAMLATLGRWYGYEFRLPDSALAASHVSIGFNADQPEEALNTVKAVLGVRMIFDGNVITLVPDQDGAPQTQPRPVHEPRPHTDQEVGK